jgi:hypothetical protein
MEFQNLSIKEQVAVLWAINNLRDAKKPEPNRFYTVRAAEVAVKVFPTTIGKKWLKEVSGEKTNSADN